MNFKFEPVAWLTAFYTVLGAVLLANEQFHVLPESWVRIAALIAGALGAWLGARARAAVTPVANPRRDEDTPLVPLRR